MVYIITIEVIGFRILRVLGFKGGLDGFRVLVAA
jgi:hypothetical protein